jgi:methyl-accepting chemotaxis protein
MRLTLGKKLGLGFGVVLIMTALGAVITYLKAEDMNRTQELVLTVRIPTIETYAKLSGDLNYTAAKVRQAILAGADRDQEEKAQKTWEAVWVDIDKDLHELDELSPHWVLQANRDRLADIERDLPAYRECQRSAIHQAAGSRADAIGGVGMQYAETSIPLHKAVEKPLNASIESMDSLLAQERERMNNQFRSLVVTLVVTTLVALGAGIFVAVFMSRRISNTTQSVLVQAEAIAAGDLTRTDLKILSDDELGDLTQAINKVNSSLRDMILAITENAEHVASASEELSAASQQITSNSEETSAQANVVTQATKKVSENLQSVSTGADEMTSTIQSIAGNAHEAATVASKAVETAKAANSTVAKLGESSAEIGEVIKVITSIAQQTNLLALNATIEAARAGEAGKGFAVVANEVKELAKQTAKATEDISQKITAIQQDTKGAVDAIGSITGVITQVNEISGTIATAVEEQSATTNEMTRNVADAAKGAGEITQNIEGVAQAAQGTSTSAQESQKAANELAEMAEQLRGLVGQFKISGRQLTGSKPAAAKPRALAAGAGR